MTSRSAAATGTALLLLLLGPASAQAHHHADLPLPAPPVAVPSDPGAPVDDPAPLEPGPLPAPAPLDPDPGVLPPAVPVDPAPALVTTATVSGRTAMLRTDGKAAIPRGAPKRIRAVIAAANQIVGKPYKWGGGHAGLLDKGYDCSGAVSYALVRGTLLDAVQVSGTLARWAAPGAGRWLTVYANAGHVYLEVAGLRLDTSAVGDPAGRDGVRWRPLIGARPRFHVRHPLGL